MRKEHSTVIFKRTMQSLIFFIQIFEKLMQFMSQTSHSPKLVYFFTKFIHSEILTLPEILFCLVEIILLLLYIGIIGQNQGIRETCFKPKIDSQNCLV